jgi:hypothetical protein
MKSIKDLGSQRTQKSTNQDIKSNFETAILAAQNCIDQLSRMLTNIEKNEYINELHVKNAKMYTCNLQTELNKIEIIIKKDFETIAKTSTSKSSNIYTETTTVQLDEPEDWWKIGPSDKSIIRDEYSSQFV